MTVSELDRYSQCCQQCMYTFFIVGFCYVGNTVKNQIQILSPTEQQNCYCLQFVYLRKRKFGSISNFNSVF